MNRHHVLYETGDAGAPDAIKDRNGEVVLGCCKICGRGEIELEEACSSGDFSIGGELWPGLSKLIEECGEVLQVAGKLMGSEGRTDHWSGDLRPMLHEELADALAAIAFFAKHNGLDLDVIEERRAAKYATFKQWHQQGVAQRVRRRG